MTELEATTSDNVVESTGSSIDALIQASSMIQDGSRENSSSNQTHQGVDEQERSNSPNQSYLQLSDGRQSPQSTQSASPHNISHDTSFQNSDISFEDNRLGFDQGRIDGSGSNEDFTYHYMESSPENGMEMGGSPTRFYKCRFCSFTASTYTQLQLHMPKHGGKTV